MDKDKVFDLFNNPNFDKKSDDEIETSIMESAHFNMKMFMKTVSNVRDFLIKFLAVKSKSSPDSSKEDLHELTQTLQFKRAFGYISAINVNRKDHVLDLDLHNPYDMGYCVKICLDYHLKHEKYTEAAFLVKFQDFLEKRYADLEIEA